MNVQNKESPAVDPSYGRAILIILIISCCSFGVGRAWLPLSSNPEDRTRPFALDRWITTMGRRNTEENKRGADGANGFDVLFSSFFI